MTEQLVLAPVHNNDPSTSVEAARKVNAAKQLLMVVECLGAADRPLSDDDIAERTGLLRNSAGTRRGIARDLGYVEAVGRTKNHRNNNVTTWALTDLGREWLREVA